MQNGTALLIASALISAEVILGTFSSKIAEGVDAFCELETQEERDYYLELVNEETEANWVSIECNKYPDRVKKVEEAKKPVRIRRK